MSTSTSTTSASPTATTTSTDDGGQSSTLSSSASLYLYTFLATLVLLLSVSAAIVVRSYVLRRRQRRIVDDAIRSGSFDPAPHRPRPFGDKPQLHDVYLLLGHHDRQPAGASRADGAWTGLMPVAASRVRATPSSGAGTSAPAPRTLPIPAWRRMRLRPPAVALAGTSLSAAPQLQQGDIPLAPLHPAPAAAPLAGGAVTLAFLVAMPGARRGKDAEGEGDLPQIEFGTAQVPVRAPAPAGGSSIGGGV